MTPRTTLEPLTADALAPLRHGFFTRQGGASSGIFAGLNCGAGSSDMAEMVTINLARVAHEMGVPPALSKGAIRVSLGWTSEPGDVDRFVASWARAYERAKAKVKTNVNAGAPRPLASVES